MPTCEHYNGKTAYLDKDDGIVYCRIARGNCPHNLEGSLIEKKLSTKDDEETPNQKKEILIHCLGAGNYNPLTNKSLPRIDPTTEASDAMNNL